ncbi:MAG: mechanosensitive ion channel [Candidatus Thorarchaeota archaeon]|nr:MAG: mechanosensitive ion channel [Candidatus Thorarchaeota archaeon]
MQTPDILAGIIELLQSYAGPVLLLTFQLILISIVYLIVTRGLRRSLQNLGMGLEASTGVVLIVRLLFFVVVVFVFLNLLGPDNTTILSVSAVFGTAIGLAFSQSVGNIVSGLYVLAARPFRVGDYVNIGGLEGIVREITLNYTRILQPDMTRQIVPNSRVVTSAVTNYRVDLKDFVKEEESEKDNKEDRTRWGVVFNAFTRLKDAAGYSVAYRYTFDLTFHQSLDLSRTRVLLNRACDKWTSVFLQRPDYSVVAAPTAAVVFKFSFIVLNPMDIIRHSSAFMDDLLAIHWEGPHS